METQEKTRDLAIHATNRRAHPRLAVDEKAVLLLVSNGSRVSCRIIELSLGGCRLRSEGRFLAGIMIRVEATFTVNGIAFRFSGVTQWTADEHVVGVRFVDVTSRRRDELAEVLCEVEADSKAKAEKNAAEKVETLPQPADAPAQEKTQKQPVLPAAAPQVAAPGPVRAAQVPLTPQSRPAMPTPPPGVLPQAMPAPQSRSGPLLPKAAPQPAAKPVNRERRTQSRLEVDTSALIFLINVGSALQGRILDLSLGGCRIRTEERFPVGIYTRVETEFRLEGLPFRLGGVIQAVHDRERRLVGIRFLDMSGRKQAQLQQLIEEIEQMEGNQKGLNQKGL